MLRDDIVSAFISHYDFNSEPDISLAFTMALDTSILRI